MALFINSQPRTDIPVPLTNEMLIKLSAPGEVAATFGGLANFIVQFSVTGGANGQPITVADQTFTTSNAQPFTRTTWDYNGTPEQVANNFANMLRSNLKFAKFNIQVREDAGNPGQWQVFVQNSFFEFREDWVFDYSLLSPPLASNSEFPGENTVLNNILLWYTVWNENTCISSIRTARVPFDTNLGEQDSVIDLTEYARQIIRHAPPPFNSLPLIQPNVNYQKKLRIRYGGIIRGEFCENFDFEGDPPESELFTAVGASFQIEDMLEFYPYYPFSASVTTLVQFLSKRPKQLPACRGSFEWIPIYIDNVFAWEFPFRAVWRFYDENDNLINQEEEDILNSGYVNIAIGHGNLQPAANISYYTLHVEGTNKGDFVFYSEVIRRDISLCDCNAAEIYYLEDTGAWGTVIFQRVEARAIEQTGFPIETKLDTTTEAININQPGQTRFTSIQAQQLHKFYIDGGKENVPIEADRVYRFTTERITAEKRPRYEELLRSREFYIRTATSTGEQIMRKLVFDREDIQTEQRGAVVRIQMNFRFNTPLNTH